MKIILITILFGSVIAAATILGRAQTINQLATGIFFGFISILSMVAYLYENPKNEH
jgi:uncharacterized membrane protein (GlpM family)